ncbi:phenylacetate--CoA ligase family protein [Capnocytophaga felis]|uniref:Capsular polysaccharide biosynthesis protein n=1 Tax=Capnocytophaga felis TaxID=2267611 RepID=A0A5M4B6W5_9FLAO|nr:phenylacetate--CoA ligase family protein [Capnocytophaga felis]GET45351.1 capsular polysaccharide biosynthesis protein [Capnocytophaga felis]GET47486.1 capsular polysaccharide biosynthesis protein [Capnocytophaga felis]
MKNVRYYLYWGIDYLTGGSKRKHYNEIAKIYNQKGDYEAIKAKRLSEILTYACKKTSFYKSFNPNNLKSFPIISKKDVNENYDSFFSEDYADKKDSLRVMTTSGSTGITFRIYQNPEKVLRNKMDILFFYHIANYDIGDRMYSLRIWTNINRKNWFSLFKENFRMYDTSNLSKEGILSLEKIMKQDKGVKVLSGYASSFAELVNNMDKKSRSGAKKWKIKSIISMAEELLLHTKKELIDIFKCPVVSRYSNQEMGMFAQQPASGEDYFLTNEASYHFEFLKLDSDEEAQEDELARIVITDLFNKAVPLIRYETGDLCTFGIKNNRKYIKTIQGRANDLLKNNNGELLPPYLIIYVLWHFKSIVQFQLIQENLHLVHLKLVHKFENKNEIFKQIENRLLDVFGNQTTIKIEEVSEIPVEKTGKRKFIISKV